MDSEILSRCWDVIIIGTGMGGGTAGRRLAELGHSVLFVEQGPLSPRGEAQELSTTIADPTARHIRGLWTKPMQVAVDGRQSEVFMPVGAGVGGTSVFYAAGLERPEPHDLEDRPGKPHPTGGWPVSYAAFSPYFERAERMFHVCGQDDPLSEDPAANLLPPAPLSEGDASMEESFRAAGLHPYRAHLAIRHLPGCTECTGRKCPRHCKMDGRSAGVEPALATGRAVLLDQCRVVALRGRWGHVTHLEAVHEGEPIELRGRQIVLAAGAIGSARLLLASAAEHWPEGCANQSGLVGRNLMFHLNELVAIWPKERVTFTGAAKAFTMRDLYFADGMRLGSVQSLGVSASYGEILHYLHGRFDRSPLRRMPFLRETMRLPAMVGARLLGDARVFCGLLEDLPYPGNRITAASDDPDGVEIQYSISDELLRRRRVFRKKIRSSFRGHRVVNLFQEPQLNLGHPCGTVRFGNDPSTSVLDPSCRAHGIDNLHVADSSFMPTSTGINPSLLIAANALRVADTVHQLAIREPVTGAQA